MSTIVLFPANTLPILRRNYSNSQEPLGISHPTLNDDGLSYLLPILTVYTIRISYPMSYLRSYACINNRHKIQKYQINTFFDRDRHVFDRHFERFSDIII